MPDPYYRYHLFFCINQRANGEPCCADKGSPDMRNYAKQRVKQLGLAGKASVRVNNAGCMDRCSAGPVLVIYPQGVWYTYADKEDIDEIIEEHLVHGRVVERLLI